MKKTHLLLSLIMLLLPLSAVSKVVVDDVKVFREGDRFVVDLFMNNPPKKSSLEVDFIRETIQVNVPGVKISKGKNLTRVSDRTVRSIYTYEPSGRILRTRVILKKGIEAARFLHSVSFERYANKIRVVVDGKGDAALASRTGEEVSVILPVEEIKPEKLISQVKLNPTIPSAIKNTKSIVMPTVLPSRETVGSATIEKSSDELIARTKEEVKKEVEGSEEESEILISKTKEDKKTEADIPLFKTSKAEETSSVQPSLQKILISLAVILMSFVVAAYAIKKWGNKKGITNSNRSIKIIAQHHLGPKRSIAIIQVAGESLLVGITEQNISMLKTLNLLDEDIPQKSFTGALSQFDQENDAFISSGRPQPAQPAISAKVSNNEDNYALTGLSEIRDRINTRLQGMKQI